MEGKQGGGDAAVDVHDGDWSTRLEHGAQRRLAVSPSAVPRRDRHADDGSGDESRHDGGQGPLPTGEDKVDLGAPPFRPPQRPLEPVQARDSDVVSDRDIDPHGLQDVTRFLGNRDVARSGRQEGYRTRGNRI